MNPAKIRLSQKEKELVINTEWILTKNRILQKVFNLLENIQLSQNEKVKACTNPLIVDSLSKNAKISKGDNYLGLPYQILDFPRLFNGENIFAIRIMFWWGNFFSITLHLSGRYKQEWINKILSSFSSFEKMKFNYCTNEDQWHHHFEKDNYLPVTINQKTEFEKEIKEKAFIKLAQKIPLEQWDNAETLLIESFNEIINILEN